MCLINFLYRVHPNYPLILLANRDESYDRPTLAADFWSDEPTLLAGRDLKMMGTWLGITKDGRFAALTNYREASLPKLNKNSRGDIIRNFLTSNEDPVAYLEKLHANRTAYDGYNVILGTTDALFYYSNIEQEIKPLQSGIYGLSNHLLNTPWPKVEKGKRMLYDFAMNNNILQPKDLIAIHTDNAIAQDDKLPNTGVGIELERILSPLFIQSDHYGTRATTVILINNAQQVEFVERSFNHGQFEKDQSFSFHIKDITQS